MDATAPNATPRRCVSPSDLVLLRSFEGVCDGDPLTVNLDAYLDPADHLVDWLQPCDSRQRADAQG